MVEVASTSVRHEYLDHIIMSETHLRRILKEYATYFNRARPHQGIHQQVPQPEERRSLSRGQTANVIALPILGGLHHEYRRAA